jgi:hypothetical protein
MNVSKDFAQKVGVDSYSCRIKKSGEISKTLTLYISFTFMPSPYINAMPLIVKCKLLIN